MSDYRLDVADQTWTVASPQAITHAAVYVERRVRDWRWLWLRRKTVIELLTVGRIDPWPINDLDRARTALRDRPSYDP